MLSPCQSNREVPQVNTLAVANTTQSSLPLIEYIQSNYFDIRRVADQLRVNARDIELQVLLHLPRFLNSGVFPSPFIFEDEVERLGTLVETRVSPFADWQRFPTQPSVLPHDLKFTEVSEIEARIIHERFHYLASYRADSIHLGLRTLADNRLVSLLTLSPFDLRHITSKLPCEISSSQVLVVSRVYSFDWAPANTISYLMGQVYKWLKWEKPDVKMLLTYINPNVGFGGSSLKASNWVFFGRESGTRYAYLDGLYTTDRELISRFGTSNPYQISHSLKERFQVTQFPLAPLLLFSYFLSKELSSRYAKGFNYDVGRP